MKKHSSAHANAVYSRPSASGTTESKLKRTLRGVLLAFLLWASWVGVSLLNIYPRRVSVAIGDVSPVDIKAPRDLTYISEVKTNEARAKAAAQIADIYDGPNLDIASQQIQHLQQVLDYMSVIRHDPYASREEKLGLLAEIPGLGLSDAELVKILDLNEERWNAVAAEALRVLDLTLREEIRPYQIDQAKERAYRLTTRTLSASELEIVAGLVQSLIVPNSFYNAKKTSSSRSAAREAVEPVLWTIRAGESVIREGEIVDALAFEKLQALGLLNASVDWREIVGSVLLSLSVVIALSAYVLKVDPFFLYRPRREILLVLMLIVAAVASRVLIPGHALLCYLFPAAAIAMLVAIFMDIQLAIVAAVVTALMVGFASNGSLELVVYTLLGSVVGALAVWRLEQLSAFARAVFWIALANLSVVLGFRFSSLTYDIRGLVQLSIAAGLNAVLAASLAFVAYAFMGRLFGVTTSLQLMELAHPTHPLFRRLLIEAPGTYHHSIVVSNMAERAAEAIGADALLARVGAYYHDIGKITRPYFFSENQDDGENPHDKLDPQTSSEIIVSHVTDGLELARRYKLPDRVARFISEHHGTMLVTYFYRRAQKLGGNPNRADFCYPGPKPQSRETAIVMLADSIEAWSRAKRPADQSELERMIRKIINDRLIDGQLDACDLTLKDLDLIRQAFSSVLKGIHHPRIQYPEQAELANRQVADGTL